MINFLFAHSRYDTRGFSHITFEQLKAMAQDPRVGPKDTAPIFAPHDGIERSKKAASQARFHALILDFDENNRSASTINMIMVDAGGFLAFTSSSHLQPKGQLPPESRWKVVIPFSEPVGADHYLKLAQGAALKFRTDPAQARLAQVCHVPNKLTADASYEVIDRTGLPFIDPDSSDFAQSCIVAFEAHEKRERVTAKATSMSTRVQNFKPSDSIIRQINEIYSVRDILRDHGYISVGSKFVAPNSTSGNPGVVILAEDGMERVYSHHNPVSDPLADGHAHDAFDLLKILRFGGDFTLALASLSNEQGYGHERARNRKFMPQGNYVPATATFATSATQWESVVPLIRKNESGMPYPIDAVPEALRLAILEVQQFTQTPLAMVATAAITAMAACIQSHYDVERAPSLWGPASLFGLILADSGERKTTVEDYFNRPILEHDKRHRILGVEELKHHKAEMEIWEEEKRSLMRAISKEKNLEEKFNTQHLLKDHLEIEPEEPRIPKISVTDITPEQLAFSLVRLWPSKYLHTSEGGVIFGGHGMKPDNILKNLAVLNTAWGGKVEGVDRRTSESFPASNGVRLSASLMVQPTVIRTFLERSGALARGSGFLARFLVSWPQSTQGYRPYKDAPGHWPALSWLHSVMDDLLQRDPLTDDEGHLTPAKLKFSEDGRQTWITVHDAIERELRKNGDLHGLRDSASKAADNVARLAAVFHCSEKREGAIDSDLIESAAVIVSWHLDESKRLFEELVVPESVQRAQMLLDWLIKECKSTGSTGIPVRKVSQYGPNSLRKKSVLHEALELLAETNHLRSDSTARSSLVILHPVLLEVVP